MSRPNLTRIWNALTAGVQKCRIRVGIIATRIWVVLLEVCRLAVKATLAAGIGLAVGHHIDWTSQLLTKEADAAAIFVTIAIIAASFHHVPAFLHYLQESLGCAIKLFTIARSALEWLEHKWRTLFGRWTRTAMKRKEF